MTRTVKLVLLGALVTAGLVSLLWLPLADWAAIWVHWVERHPHVAWPVFILTYVAATVVAIPGLPLTLASGFLFGIPIGVVLTSIGSTLGACTAFLVGRYIARAWVADHIASRRLFTALDLATKHEGFTIVFLARLSPVFPYNVMNFVLGLTSVRFRDYAFASWLGMLPLTIVYVSVGAAADNLRAVIAGDLETGITGRIVMFAGLAATIAVVVLLTRSARRALDRHLRAEISSRAPPP